eukprot:m.733027 g.733027  ORF g.733027 m.733027 type:complete len:75 (-) comp23069_c0_seq1:2658-2882(-)
MISTLRVLMTSHGKPGARTAEREGASLCCVIHFTTIRRTSTATNDDCISEILVTLNSIRTTCTVRCLPYIVPCC